MVNLEYLERLKLVSRPWGQKIVASLLLFPNYNIFARVDIRVEGMEHIPRDENVIFAMNHTDRFNYWPFQYKLWSQRCFPYSTVWVKAKYYQNALLARGLDLCNLIPVPSLGYLLEEFFQERFRRKPDKQEYRIFKDLIEGKKDEYGLSLRIGESFAALGESFIEQVRNSYEEIMSRVAEISKAALFEKNLNLIIFPEGTRSVKFGGGKNGLAQIALNTGKKVIPVGCNNSENVYKGSLPFARSGYVLYRVGEPLTPEGALKECQIGVDFKLFSKESRERYEAQFNRATEIIMGRINGLLDSRYRAGAPG